MKDKIKNFKFNIRTHLVTGILMLLLVIFLFAVMPSQIKLPGYDSGAPSPRVIPSLCLIGIGICAVVLIIQSVILKKDKIYTFELTNELPIILMIIWLIVYVALIINLGFVIAGFIVFPVLLIFCKEKKPGPYIVAIVADIVVFILFKKVFHISLPTSPFGITILGVTF